MKSFIIAKDKSYGPRQTPWTSTFTCLALVTQLPRKFIRFFFFLLPAIGYTKSHYDPTNSLNNPILPLPQSVPSPPKKQKPLNKQNLYHFIIFINTN